MIDKVSMTLTIYFENPFWVGIFERVVDANLMVARIVFGSEPKDYEIYNYILKYDCQLQWSPSVSLDDKTKHVNPKRLQRLVKQQTQNVGISTKSQLALQKQQELKKQIHQQLKHQNKEMNAKKRFEMKQQKKKMKHRGK